MGGLINQSEQRRAAQTLGLDPPDETVVTTASNVHSHLDSVFESSGWTREDVLVVAASLQVVMWIALLYLEVTG